MTDAITTPTAAVATEVPPPRRPWLSRLLEFGIWVIAPFVVAIVGIILALIFGAPQQRVIGVFATIALIAGGYFMWRPSTRFKVRRARAAGLLWTALIAFMGVTGSSAPSPTAPAQVTQQHATQTGQMPSYARPAPTLTPDQQAAQRQQQAAAAAAEQERARTEYVQRLDRELQGTTAQSLLESTNTPDNIIITVAVFSALATVYADGATMALSPEQERARQRFKSRVIALQVQVLPQLRARYAVAASHAVWEDDMEVRALGAGNRTIDLIWAGFAANRNIAEFHAGAAENLTALRFKRARYMWYRDAEQWHYYTLNSPNDGDLATLQDGTWVIVH